VILLCGIPSEPPIELAARAAADAGIAFQILNQREIDAWALELDFDGDRLDGVLHGPAGDIALDEIDGAYVRLVEPRTLPDVGRPPDKDKLEAANALYQPFVDWLEVAWCRVANRLSAGTSNVSKPYQAQIIRSTGFEIPPTIVSNDPESIRGFVAEHREVVYKSTSSARSIVRRLVPSRLDELALVRHLPTQFQALIPGTDVRVHVVGELAIATEVRSPGTDYRYAGRDDQEVRMAASELPPETEARCLSLAEALDLPFCGIDLRRTPEDRWYCFEVNPSPAYSYFEQQTGQPIGRALVEYLAGEIGRRDGDGAGDRELGRPVGHAS
jgi:ribosomal protein S6-L-glutamate ligase RimK-like protein